MPDDQAVSRKKEEANVHWLLEHMREFQSIIACLSFINYSQLTILGPPAVFWCNHTLRLPM